MQRLAILTAFSFAAVGWMIAGQPALVAFQAEPQTPQQVESPAAASASPAAGSQADESETAGAAAAPPLDPAVVAAAEKLLRDARDRLYASPAVRAKFTERATIGARRFTASGSYVSGVFPALKLEYRVQIGGSEGVLVEACDGSVLRTSKEVRPIGSNNAKPTLSHWTRKDINQILEASYVEGTPDQAILQAELSLGGVPTLLASLERTMLFDTLREQTWQGKPVTVIEGGWRLERLQAVAQQMGSVAQSVAPFVPDRVRVYFDRETLFPTRILYRKLANTQPPSYMPLMSIEFTDIQFPKEIDAIEFRYVPPKGVDEIDETQLYLQMIKQMQAAVPPPAEGGAPVDATSPATGQAPAGSTLPPGATEAAPAKQ